MVMVVRVVKVVMNMTDRGHKGQTGDREGTDRTDLRQTKLTVKLDLPDLCLTAFAVLAMFLIMLLWIIELRERVFFSQFDEINNCIPK